MVAHGFMLAGRRGRIGLARSSSRLGGRGSVACAAGRPRPCRSRSGQEECPWPKTRRSHTTYCRRPLLLQLLPPRTRVCARPRGALLPEPQAARIKRLKNEENVANNHVMV